MKMCPDCNKLYDEAEYSGCPYCSGELDEDMEEYKVCPECGDNTMHWFGDCWICENCGHEDHSNEDDCDEVTT